MQIDLVVRQAIALLRHDLASRLAVRAGTRAGSIFFAQELGWLLGRDEAWLLETAVEYRRCRAAWRRLTGWKSPGPDTDGFALSLDPAEGFAAWALVKHLRPRVVVELGTQYGVSARLWKEALSAYVPGHELVLVDLQDERRFIGDAEATFLVGDARRIYPELLASRRVDLLFNDAHPYEVIRGSVLASLEAGVPALVFHDVGGRHPRSLFRAASFEAPPEEKARVDDFEYRAWGTWERHVMAEVFGRELLHAERLEAAGRRIQVFDSLFGLGIALAQPAPTSR